ncbi:group II truncated hemoglobin [Sphingobium sp. JS3065]|uniref:group II truncated hemoglobin n=1 Tax=Sphingobium sp. JS3065 TaxID=2970925 RepID=UPI002264AD9B|nr:group II truncated hemoglobin [Sphingobium sp. JS3065]UZW57264.1 group II truncated hemoglobin [Sphingobium sp. JS3065]
MTTPYARIGGEPAVAAIVNRFYDLVEQDAAFADLRALHAADLAAVRHGLTRFLSGWAGGPRDWFDHGPCIMSLHRAFPITPALADQWSAAMTRAIAAQAGLDPQLAQAMAQALDHMAHAMVNLSFTENAA